MRRLLFGRPAHFPGHFPAAKSQENRWEKSASARRSTDGRNAKLLFRILTRTFARQNDGGVLLLVYTLAMRRRGVLR